MKKLMIATGINFETAEQCKTYAETLKKIYNTEYIYFKSPSYSDGEPTVREATIIEKEMFYKIQELESKIKELENNKQN